MRYNMEEYEFTEIKVKKCFRARREYRHTKERRKKSKTQKHKDTIDRENEQQKDTKNIKIP